MEERACQTPLEDLRRDALEHYDELATKACHHSSVIPKAINHYFDSLRKKNKWISVEDRLPTNKEVLKNWKFLVCNNRDNWTDAAYYSETDGDLWDNGECGVIPTHWMPLPTPPKNIEK
jgi:hypothetical protein